ncbi:meiotic mRNA stability protein kinase Ssn3p [Diutina catenulata]
MLPQPALMASSSILTLAPYKHRKDLTRESVLSTYQVIGYIAAGTYGKVYKAKIKKEKEEGGSSTNLVAAANDEPPEFFAIKKFKSDNHKSHHDINGNEITHYTGISQSAMREMSLCRELAHKNIIKLVNIVLENKSIYMIFEFCEHDLLQIIHFHSHPVKDIPQPTIKSIIWQILNGVTYLHKNWVFHRDLKPANIMVTSSGIVKVGDLGLARKFNNPLQSLYTGDKVVVTIWYRAPELLLGARHYSPAIDLWAVGCILAELLSLRPIFKGEEAKIDMNNKKSVPFQKNQFQKIVDILGTPTAKTWPSLAKYPEYPTFSQSLTTVQPPQLLNWYKLIGGTNKQCLMLLKGLLEYEPSSRLTADEALQHPYFQEAPKFSENCFEGVPLKYPKRRIYTDDSDILYNVSSIHNYKRHGAEDAARKRQR